MPPTLQHAATLSYAAWQITNWLVKDGDNHDSLDDFHSDPADPADPAPDIISLWNPVGHLNVDISTWKSSVLGTSKFSFQAESWCETPWRIWSQSWKVEALDGDSVTEVSRAKDSASVRFSRPGAINSCLHTLTNCASLKAVPINYYILPSAEYEQQVDPLLHLNRLSGECSSGSIPETLEQSREIAYAIIRHSGIAMYKQVSGLTEAPRDQDEFQQLVEGLSWERTPADIPVYVDVWADGDFSLEV